MDRKEMGAVIGTIGLTDYNWYQFLSQRPEWEEVNFWRPSARNFRADPFSPFLFKLKAPHNAIAGFGYFARYSVLPEWLAWECFGAANGCATPEELRALVNPLRHSSNSSSNIGCTIIVDVTFFAPEDWVRQPADWPKNMQMPKKYDLTQGEGLRVWMECQERSASYTRHDQAAEQPVSYGTPTSVVRRLGQGAFRVAVTDAYKRACAVTEEHSLPALEAAHIRPVKLEGSHSVRNGLLLRADLHRLFDNGYITVAPDQKLVVSSRLKADYDNGRTYYPLHGKEIVLPCSSGDQPDPDLLRWHNDHVFLAC